MTALPPDSIPNSDEFQIRERSNTLLAEWSKIATPATNGEAPPPPPAAAEPTANGDTNMVVDALAPAVMTAAVAQETSGADAEADVEMKEDAPAPASREEPAAEAPTVTAA